MKVCLGLSGLAHVHRRHALRIIIHKRVRLFGVLNSHSSLSYDITMIFFRDETGIIFAHFLEIISVDIWE